MDARQRSLREPRERALAWEATSKIAGPTAPQGLAVNVASALALPSRVRKVTAISGLVWQRDADPPHAPQSLCKRGS